MRRKASLVLSVVSIVGVVGGTLGGCASDESAAANPDSSVQPATPTAQPRRYRLSSGDALGNEILRSDPSLSAGGAPARATASAAATE